MFKICVLVFGNMTEHCSVFEKLPVTPMRCLNIAYIIYRVRKFIIFVVLSHVKEIVIAPCLFVCLFEGILMLKKQTFQDKPCSIGVKQLTY